MAGNSSQVHSSPFSRAHHHRNNNQLSLRSLSVQMHIHSQCAEKNIVCKFSHLYQFSFRRIHNFACQGRLNNPNTFSKFLIISIYFSFYVQESIVSSVWFLFWCQNWYGGASNRILNFSMGFIPFCIITILLSMSLQQAYFYHLH